MRKIMTFAAALAVLFMLSLWTPADAASRKGTDASNANVTVTADMSARRHHRRYHRRHYRPYYGYYGPRPYYGYARPYYARPYYARPYYGRYYRSYYAPPPFFFGFPF